MEQSSQELEEHLKKNETNKRIPTILLGFQIEPRSEQPTKVSHRWTGEIDLPETVLQ